MLAFLFTLLLLGSLVVGGFIVSCYLYMRGAIGPVASHDARVSDVE